MKSIKMVWHIFKKDVRLLWPFVLGAAGIQFAQAAVRYRLDQVGVADAQTLDQLLQLLMPASLLAAGLLIATAVHQDALPGVRQDWLVRPVKRKDLLSAKLLFLLVMVHGPILLADMFETMAHGFSPGQALVSAITRGLLWLGIVTLPALAFASLTRNMTETVVGGVVLFLCIAAPRQFLGRWHLPPTSGTGLEWVTKVSVTSLLFLGAAVILTMQYFRRKTMFSRWLVLAVACLAFLALYIPWQVSFAVEKRLSPTPGAARSILPVYAPTLGRFLLPEGVNRNAVSQGNGGFRYEASTVYVPVHITALPDDGVLNTDRSQVRLLALDGKLLYQGPGDDLLVRKLGHRRTDFTIGLFGFKRTIKTDDLSVPQDGEAWIYHGIALPPGIYAHIKNQPLRLEIDYSFTLLQGSGTYNIPALDGNRVLPGLGRCTTRMDDDGDDVSFDCFKTGSPPPSLAQASLEHVPSGRRNPTAVGYLPDYAPFLDQINPDGIARFGVGLRFHDHSGLAKYPVEAADLPQSRVVVRVYQPQEHFTRQLVIPQIRLSDWESVEHKQLAQNH